MIDFQEYSWYGEWEDIMVDIFRFLEVSHQANRNNGVHEDPCPDTEEAGVESVTIDPKGSQHEVFDRVSEIGIIEGAQHRDERL